MKRLNQYLLTHHPLLWNMRIHWVVPALLLLHLLFYGAGLAYSPRLSELDYSSTRLPAAATSLAVLVGILVVIGWLVFYLRNNAFKSFYPVRNGRLFAEFLLSALIIGLASTLPVTHQAGRYQRLDALTKGIDLTREINTEALAFHFLPFESTSFYASNSCDSQRRDDSVNAGLLSDTPPPPERADYAYAYDTLSERSYLHYCGTSSMQYSRDALTKYGADSIAKRWLLNGRQDSIRRVLTDYLALVKTYGGAARFSVDQHVAEIFATPRFLVRTTLLGYDDRTNPRAPFIITNRVYNALHATEEVREGVLSLELVLLYGYWVFGAALLLFSFRITRLRTWFGAGIGVGIWMAILATLAAALEVEDAPLLAFLALVIASIVFSAVQVSRRRNKTAAGFAFLWGVWGLVFFVPALLAYIAILLRRDEVRYTADGMLINYHVSPIATWIDNNMEGIALANLVLMLLLVAVYVIPQARRWQAAPEE